MSKSSTELADKLYSIASSELFLYKGMLSCTRLIAINLKNGGVKDSDALYEKQKSYMDKIDNIHIEYVAALKGIQNQTLESVLFLKSPIPTEGFPEFSQLFPVLSELRKTIDKITESNNYAIEQAAKLSSECMEKIKDLQKQQSFSSVFDAQQDANAGHLFNYTEK